jgi:heterodisulfide reductase subunit C
MLKDVTSPVFPRRTVVHKWTPGQAILVIVYIVGVSWRRRISPMPWCSSCSSCVCRCPDRVRHHYEGR